MQTNAVLHLMCGMAASGKSTFARKLAKAPGTVLLEEDVWLSRLYADTLSTLKDYVRCSTLLKEAIEPHVVELLRNGVSVVLDFPANTRENRAWMRKILNAAQCEHRLHFFDVPDQVCKERLRRRNASTQHPFSLSEAQFDVLATYFERPTPDEGFNLETHSFD